MSARAWALLAFLKATCFLLGIVATRVGILIRLLIISAEGVVPLLGRR